MAMVGDVIKIRVARPEAGVVIGDEGTIVYAFDDDGEAYEVEFLDSDGFTKAVLTLEPSEFDVVWKQV